MKTLIETLDYEGIRNALIQNPKLANQAIALSDADTRKAHPLHRICDGVFHGIYSDAAALEMAKILLEFGAAIDGNELMPGKDSPLIAAVSLGADAVALLYMAHGADVHHPGTHGGTALHWAAWCGRDRVVEQLIKAGADVNKRCMDFQSTPLFWAVHALKNGGEKNRFRQENCMKILLAAGADKQIPNAEGVTPVELLDDNDVELKLLLQ